MDIMSGKGVSKGIAIGAIKFYQRIELDAKKRSITDPEAEIERFHSASSTASVQLSELCIKLAEKLGTQNSLLFEIHKMMHPEEAVLADYRERLAQQLAHQAKLEQLKGKTAVSVDGQQVLLCANIGGVDDAELALENDADGIGLFRSEFLYLQTSDYPTEDAQFDAYKAVAEKMDGRPVVIRTLDIGADKQIDYFEMEKEENPALGYRAIRICLVTPKSILPLKEKVLSTDVSACKEEALQNLAWM